MSKHETRLLRCAFEAQNGVLQNFSGLVLMKENVLQQTAQDSNSVDFELS